MGCGEPRANAWTAEQSKLLTDRRYVLVRPAPPPGSLLGRLAGEGQAGGASCPGAGERRLMELVGLGLQDPVMLRDPLRSLGWVTILKTLLSGYSYFICSYIF